MAALIWRLPPRSRRWRSVRPELTGIGARPAARASLASVAKRAAPAISPTSFAAVSGPNPGSIEQLRRDLADELGDLGFQRVDRLGQLAQTAQLVAGDPDAHRLLGARQAPRDARAPLAVEQRAAGQLELGPEVVQVPLQRVIERRPARRTSRSRWSTSSRMSSSGPASSAVGNVSRPSAKRRARDGQRIDRSDLPRSRLERRELAISRVGTRTTRSPRAIKNRSNEPETCRQSSSAHTRSRPSPRAHCSTWRKAAGADR